MADEILKAKLQQIDANDTQIGTNDERIATNDLEIKGQVNALRQYGMGVTGIQRDRLGDVVYDLADGYGQGGGGGWRPETVVYPTNGFANLGYMLAADGSLNQRASAATTGMMPIPENTDYLEISANAFTSAGVRIVVYRNSTPAYEQTIVDQNVHTISVANMAGFKVGAGVIATTKTVTITYAYKED